VTSVPDRGASAAAATAELAPPPGHGRERTLAAYNLVGGAWVRAGVIHVNSPTTGAEVYVPFGGIKASGWGPREQARAALDFYTESVTVYEDV
jgi:hypothetical protein